MAERPIPISPHTDHLTVLGLQKQLAEVQKDVELLKPAKVHWVVIGTFCLGVLMGLGGLVAFIFNKLGDKAAAESVVDVSMSVDQVSARVRAVETGQAETRTELKGLRDDLKEIKGALLYPRRRP